MPCVGHTIFYSTCGHVFLAQPQTLECESASSQESNDATLGTETHTPPRQFPCNKYLSYTIQISSSLCQECTALPKEFTMQRLRANQNDVEAFDKFATKWLKHAEANINMEAKMRDAALASLKDKGTKTGSGQEMQVEKKGREREAEPELSLWGWQEAGAEEYEGVGDH